MGQGSVQLPATLALPEVHVLFVVVVGVLVLFNPSPLCPSVPGDLHMHVDYWICLVYERGSRSLYVPVRRAVQTLCGLIFILASGNFYSMF